MSCLLSFSSRYSLSLHLRLRLSLSLLVSTAWGSRISMYIFLFPLHIVVVALRFDVCLHLTPFSLSSLLARSFFCLSLIASRLSLAVVLQVERKGKDIHPSWSELSIIGATLFFRLCLSFPINIIIIIIDIVSFLR